MNKTVCNGDKSNILKNYLIFLGIKDDEMVRLFQEGSMLKERGRQVPVVDFLSPGPKFSYLSVHPLLPTMEAES